MKALGFALILLFALAGCAAGPKNAPKERAGGPGADSKLQRARVHTELGVSYYEAGKLAVALEELNEALSADRNYAPAWNARALVYMELKEDARAESDFKQALRADPDGSDAKNNYGLFLCQRNRPKEGIAYLLDAVKNPLYSTPDLAWKNAGLCARRAGDPAAAVNYFQRALQLNPGQPQALYSMADLSFAGGDAGAAKQYLDRYMRVVPAPGVEVLWLGARVEHRVGNRTAMMGYGNQLRRRFPEAPETKAFFDGRFQ
jgi:type IV pilus assembly protein PilF